MLDHAARTIQERMRNQTVERLPRQGRDQRLGQFRRQGYRTHGAMGAEPGIAEERAKLEPTVQNANAEGQSSAGIGLVAIAHHEAAVREALKPVARGLLPRAKLFIEHLAERHARAGRLPTA